MLPIPPFRGTISTTIELFLSFFGGGTSVGFSGHNWVNRQQNPMTHLSGQILSATKNTTDFPQKGSVLEGEMGPRLFQGNLGW